MLLAIVGFMILFRISRPMDKIRWGIFIFSIVGLIFSSTALRELFAITGMSMKCIMLFGVFTIVTEPMMRYLTLLFEWIQKKISQKRSDQK